jgi:hypothetical protein
MRIEKCLKNFVCLLVLASSTALAHASTIASLWFGGQGPTNGTATGVSDDQVGYINTDGGGLTTVEVDPATNSYYSVGLDTNANLYFGLASDGTLRSGRLSGGQLQQLQITAPGDLAYAFAVDPSNHIVYLGLWGSDSTGADLIEIPYNPTNGQMSSPYDPTTGSITNLNGVLLSQESTTNNFVMARQMWVAPGGNQIYYVDNDFGDPGDYGYAGGPGVQLNGLYVVNTAVTNPQPEMLSLASQFPAGDENSQVNIVGLAVNPSKNLIYFATSGPAPGVDTASNTIWSMPITGTNATAMPLPAGVSLVYPNSLGGCLALDSSAQVLYVSDQGRGTVMQLSLSANGLGFTGGTSNFFTLDAEHLTDGANGFPSAFVQGLDFAFVSIVPIVPPSPRLTITRQGSNAVVSWPLADSIYTLQFASVLATNAWTAYPGPFFTNGSVITVTNAIPTSTHFFRLSY